MQYIQRIQLYFIFLFSFFLAAKVPAQTLNLNYFGIEDGLPQSGVSAMTQDRAGNLWIGTMAGAAKYNGLNFESFSKRDGLAENRITACYTDRMGNIWFGHWTGGISKYNPRTKKFYEVKTGNLEIFRTINCIMEDSHGNMLFGTNGQGLLKYTPSAGERDSTALLDSTNGKFILITAKEGLSSNVVHTMAEDKHQLVWVGTSQGITKMDIKGDSDKYSLAVINGLPAEKFTFILIDSKQNLWLGTEDKGVFRSSIKDPRNFHNYSVNDGMSSNHVKVIFEDANGNIFIGSTDAGISKYLPDLERNKYNGPIFQIISTSQGLSNDRINCIIQDREKNIWIGTALYLNQYFDEQFEIFGPLEGLKNSLIWSIIQDKKGNYWLGTEGGLVKFTQRPNPQDNKFENYAGNGRGIMHVTALYEDMEGQIWFSHFGNGVSRLNPSTRQIVTFNRDNGLKSNEAYCITGDLAGNVWIGTNKGGVSKFDIRTKKIITYTKEEGLGSNQVYSIHCDKKGNMWMGTLGGDLTVFDGRNFRKITKKNGYNGSFTLCITEDANGNIWLGTYDGGIYKYNGKEFRNYTQKDGLSFDTPFLLQCDNNNNLWIGSYLGVDKFNLKEESVKHYGKQDGFLGIEINPNASCKDRDGNLWFGSIIGLVKYNARREKNNTTEPIVQLKSPRLFFEDFEMPDDHQLSYSQNHITFDFVATSLTNPKRVRYKYKLEGLDKEWSPLVKQNFVTYPNLAPGEYTFMITAFNSDGIGSKEPIKYSFVIDPPFWKRWWFYGIVIVVLAGSVVFYVSYREQKLRERNLWLEKIVTERTQELRDEKDKVEKQNLLITDSIDYAKRIQDAVFVPYNSIQQAFPQSFILFRPKDIVSGDFYWLYTSGKKILFAAADCTGHGVPGAFMSIIGYNLLNNIVKEKNVLQPSLILDELSKMIVETLYQSEEIKVKDGMDIALCAIDTEKMQLEFAGAYNPLYLVRGGELKEIKADALPVGKTKLHESGNFTNHIIPLQKNDIVYIFSDGYADQIGGPNRKKFFYGPFRKLLTEISNKPMPEQRETLDKTITEWLGTRSQVDDIIVMGVKF